MDSQYLVVYTIVFSVMFNVMVFVSQEKDAFKGGAAFFVALPLIVLAPLIFFACALPVVARLPKMLTMSSQSVLRLMVILYLVSPVYGWQQLWLIFAKAGKWGKVASEAAAYGWWGGAFVLCGLFPIIVLYCLWKHPGSRFFTLQ